MGNINYIKHAKLISLLKRDYELRRIRNYSQEVKEELIKEVKILIKDLISDISHDDQENVVLPDWTFTRLIINATNLLIYRECLGMAEEFKEKYDNNYIEFLNGSLINEAIFRSNPFVLHEHLLHLGNIIARYQDMQSGKVAPNQHIIDNIEAYKNMLGPLQAKIDALNHGNLGAFKDYLKTLMNYTYYIASNAGQANSFLKEAFICARVGALYNDKSENDSPIESKALQGFYTCGAGLFARVPLKSFEGVLDHIKNLGEFKGEELIKFIDAARVRFTQELEEDTNLKSIRRL